MAVIEVLPLEQRMSALARGNEIRSYRARLKKDVAAGRVPYDRLLERGPHDDRLRSMKLEDALKAMPAIGPRRVKYILRDAQISPRATLGGVSPQAWERLYRVLESYPSINKRLMEARG